MEETFRISVRELVAFCFPPEDITPGGTVGDMLAGGQAHRARQGQQEGQPERPVSRLFQLHGEAVELFGRMDAFTDGETPLVEEIKLSAWQGGQALPEHRAQAVCYGAMAAAEEKREAVRVRVSYVDLRGEVLRSFEELLTARQMEEETVAWLESWLVFAIRERAHRAQRDLSLQTLPFPYERYRAGQRELAAQVYTAIARKKRLFASLPTGTGKSAAVLFPALKAMGEGKTTKIRYLTARNTARQSPLAALERMKQQGLAARVTVLTAREKLCPQPECCHPENCPRAKGHYLRQGEAIAQLLYGPEPLWTDQVILQTAERWQLCPFELALALTELADVVLMDLNYVFDPFAQVKRLMARRRSMTLLVDEAHHAADRVRESLSGTLDSASLRELRAGFGKRNGRKHPGYRALGEVLHLLEGLEPQGEECRLEALPEGLAASVERLLAQFSGGLGPGESASQLTVVRLCMPFLYAVQHLDEDYAILLSRHGRERTLTLYCLLPAREMARATKGVRGAVFFSATLRPLPAMKQLLGGGEEDACFALPSPFPPENLLVVRRRISTRYGEREGSADQVAQSIAQAVQSRLGKYIAYFPSYAYLELVRARLREEELPPLWVQRREMSEEDRADFFQAFSEEGQPRLGLCVLGGLFSEGVDLPGERLIGVIIVGVGLPTPSSKLRAIQACYESHFGDGFGYACRIPAMQKVLQAGGRVIRSETDTGLLMLLDSRYYDREYAALLPPEWQLRDEKGTGMEEKKWIGKGRNEG